MNESELLVLKSANTLLSFDSVSASVKSSAEKIFNKFFGRPVIEGLEAALSWLVSSLKVFNKDFRKKNNKQSRFDEIKLLSKKSSRLELIDLTLQNVQIATDQITHKEDFRRIINDERS